MKFSDDILTGSIFAFWDCLRFLLLFQILIGCSFRPTTSKDTVIATIVITSLWRLLY